MIIETTKLKGVFLIKPKIFRDKRGYFYESFNARELAKSGIKTNFLQDNQSLSGKNILRGLHFQKPPFSQAKLVRVILGAVLDVVVDIRKDSATYGQYLITELSESNFYQLYIPEGFAHGFLTLHNQNIFHYKCTEYYYPLSEAGIPWNDPDIDIKWGIKEPELSEKDKNHPLFRNFKTPF